MVVEGVSELEAPQQIMYTTISKLNYAGSLTFDFTPALYKKLLAALTETQRYMLILNYHPNPLGTNFQILIITMIIFCLYITFNPININCMKQNCKYYVYAYILHM